MGNDIREALKAIVDFCDDPRGSESGVSLAVGLSGLLPAARQALSAPPPTVTEDALAKLLSAELVRLTMRPLAKAQTFTQDGIDIARKVLAALTTKGAGA